MKYKASGFGFDVNASYDVSDAIAVWADFTMAFCSDAKMKEGDYDWASISESLPDDASKAINILSIGAGAAYKLNLNIPVDLSIGAGPFFERTLVKVSYTSSGYDVSGAYKMSNIGLSLYADAKYMFNDNLGVGLTLMPHIGLLNITSITSEVTGYDPTSYKASGFKFSFSMPIVIGVSYSF